ncbi:MAG: hypothetical protein JKX69_14345 [Rhodobacteraceae bacterium]|nr:hypothetical protein [Paracoccaceae bacterium]
MTDLPVHFCPGCGMAQQANPRYPWYFCKSCADKTAGGDGRALVFTNQSLSGGFSWRYANQPDGWTDCGGAACLIGGRAVLATEARFGGIVIQPLLSGQIPAHLRNVTDLRHPTRP